VRVPSVGIPRVPVFSQAVQGRHTLMSSEGYDTANFCFQLKCADVAPTVSEGSVVPRRPRDRGRAATLAVHAFVHLR